jgi:hypothetical protein
VLGVPGEYAAWASWLDAFGRGEDLPDAHLAPVDERMGPHMTERLLRLLAAAFETRGKRWGDLLTRHLASETVRRPSELAAALVAARGRLRPLRRLAEDRRLPEQVRAELAKSLEQMTRTAQDSLEQSARRQAGGSEQILAVVRSNSLLVRAANPARLGDG